MYPIDPKVAEVKGIRKYGFHGLSYAYITKAVASFLRKASSRIFNSNEQPVGEISIIALHLGSGASACAIRNGKSVDTTYCLSYLL